MINVMIVTGAEDALVERELFLTGVLIKRELGHDGFVHQSRTAADVTDDDLAWADVVFLGDEALVARLKQGTTRAAVAVTVGGDRHNAIYDELRSAGLIVGSCAWRRLAFSPPGALRAWVRDGVEVNARRPRRPPTWDEEKRMIPDAWTFATIRPGCGLPSRFEMLAVESRSK